MKVPVYNMENKEVGTAEVSDTLFGSAWNDVLVKRAYTVTRSNARIQRSYLRSWSDVSGGGRKPWRQKGTGRARHGSIRSPLWKGGGVAFGGALNNFARKVNKKELQAAVAMLFSRRFKDGELKVVDTFDAGVAPKEIRTRVGGMLSRRKTLLLTANGNKAFARVVKNMPRVDVVRAGSLGIADLVNHRAVLVEQKALTEL